MTADARPGTPAGVTTDGEAPSFADAPVITLPKGGGGIRGIGEKFTANAATGTGSLTVPVAVSPGRGGFGPTLALSYDTGRGNGPFGLGWTLGLPTVTRKTDKTLPRYADALESDVFVLGDAEDLVPEMALNGGVWRRVGLTVPGHRIDRYRPRVERVFTRIERWTSTADGVVHWRTVSRDGVTTVYGQDAGSRIADPADPRRVFSWLVCESYDDRGNAVVYEYKAEDATGVPLHHRTPAGVSANRYLKRIRYGNRGSRLVDTDPATMDWSFEVVLDYGEHDPGAPTPAETRPWPGRPDPFSTYRAGFEVRTSRRCRRILMFHHFPDEPGVGTDCLVSSTDVSYTDSPVASLLAVVDRHGYRRTGDGYLRRSLPPLELDYQPAQLHDTVHELDATTLADLPAGLGQAAGRWVDLDGDGVPGLLVDQADAWHFHPNLGGGRIAAARTLPAAPASAGPGQIRLLDLAGDGRLDVVDFMPGRAGFFERDDNLGWSPFTPFRALPTVDFADPRLRLVDLDGDGRAEVLLTDTDVVTWYPSLGEDGFDAPRTTPVAADEARGLSGVFGDGTGSLHLADMSGDGLADLVRVRVGEVCYWPNLGHGRFGAKVTMAGSLRLDAADTFDPSRVRLADIDGSGLADLIYLAADGVRVWLNESGNGYAPMRSLTAFPVTAPGTDVDVIDLLGTGTACLVWSSPLPGDAGHQIRYADLMGGVKPYLLVGARNNLGGETRITYTSSTTFLLADRAAGRQWATRLPFPVHVVEQIETLDHVVPNRFVTRYAYHHGAYDGVEGEFRGFGMVEQWDSERIGAAADEPTGEDFPAPPVYTRTWFHTGDLDPGGQVSRRYAEEYWTEPGGGPADLLADTVLPAGLTADEARQAARALKGMTLRQEMYGLDGSERERLPYAVSEHNATIRLLQPCAGNRHAVFLAHERETLGMHHERTLWIIDGASVADPRVEHVITLAVDDFGNVLRSASVAYGRRRPDPALSAVDRVEQARLRVTVAEHRFTNAVVTGSAYRAPQAAESRSFELVGVPAPVAGRYTVEELGGHLAAASDGTHDLPYEAVDTAPPGGPFRRLLAHSRSRYRADDLTGPLPLGVLESLAIRYDSQRLALTAGLVAGVYGDRVDDATLAGAGYVRDGADWWAPSGLVSFTPQDTTAAGELAEARRHFFQPRRFVDPYGATSTVDYDRYDLFAVGTRDPLGNRTRAVVDYRVLQLAQVTDVNDNRSAVMFDALGLVAGTAVLGKADRPEGDSTDGFVADLPEADVEADAADPLADPLSLLGPATTRTVHDLFGFWRTRDDPEPAGPSAHTISRVTHGTDLAPGAVTAVEHTVVYTDGTGQELQRKARVADGPGGVPRWVCSGWTVRDSKGRPVRAYEPFFSHSHRPEFARTAGVAAITCYDAPGRVVATLHPDHSYDKTVVDPWRQEHWDRNDTVLDRPDLDPVTGGFVARLARDEYLPTWHDARAGGALGEAERSAAVKATAHAATPSVTHLNSQGRQYLSFQLAGAARLRTRRILDVEGNERAVVDPLGRTVVTHVCTPHGQRIRSSTMDAGERRVLPDLAGNPCHVWDSRGHHTRTRYDLLRRPTETLVRVDGEPERVVSRVEYGEALPDARERNLRGVAHRTFDGAGLATTGQRDFKGNETAVTRTFAVEYQAPPDWSGAVVLEAETYRSATRFDARNRPVLSVAPHSTPTADIGRPSYDAAGLLTRLDVWLRRPAVGAGTETPSAAPGGPPDVAAVTGIEYDAKGQRTRVEHGNGVVTTYEYDPRTFRLDRLLTRRGAQALQDLRYTYDPVGNVVSIRDEAQQALYFRNQLVDPHNDYTYDAHYRLTEATGREHVGDGPAAPGPTDGPRTGLVHPGDGSALARYTQRYRYDDAGNLLEVAHTSGGAADGWTRRYTYGDTNQLAGTRVGAGPEEPYTYDPHGNMTSMPHLSLLVWDHADRLVATARQTVAAGSPETTYAVYDDDGRRVRKVTVRASTTGHPGTRASERRYLNGFEVHREYAGDGVTVTLERQTLHIQDGDRRVALVETRTAGTDPGAATLVRYQHGNQLGSATLELDDAARIISYEEYHPYGSTAYQAARAQTETPKRYRYLGRERDTETGLCHHDARSYAPWLGRWTSTDPIGVAGGLNLYEYAANRPTVLKDPSGLAPEDDRKPAAAPPASGTPPKLGYLDSTRSRSVFAPPGYTPPVEPWEEGNISYSEMSVRHKDLVGGGLFSVITLMISRWSGGSSADEGRALKAGAVVAGIAGPFAGLPHFRNASTYHDPKPPAPSPTPAPTAPTREVQPFEEPHPPEVVYHGQPTGGTERSLDELRAEVAYPGRRVIAIGREGGAQNSAVVYEHNGRISFPHPVTGNPGETREYAEMTLRLLDLPPNTRATWWSGTHGDPKGNFSGRLLHDYFYRLDKGEFRGWNFKVRNVADYSKANVMAGKPGANIYFWCYSNAAVRMAHQQVHGTAPVRMLPPKL
ncbi:SpvB/TcaC N-terminal domain-containing protein [Micromonospora sp. WMMD1076]|uniref:SpvB/TcaC N-terminal domain-containing protein n=1 Tax=Micromonospora sp. WMMD1076 TaxID=3016103 RepID=UPI00249C67A6|nr:SpvB/TcaC N-terminal domain-containing protein [Micromonospora sp. WMMD1076]WFF05832.1 SpvB/TcaC N-terminal domain-containing protein [Micromonospora sp. WMMD1076]